MERQYADVFIATEVDRTLIFSKNFILSLLLSTATNVCCNSDCEILFPPDSFVVRHSIRISDSNCLQLGYACKNRSTIYFVLLSSFVPADKLTTTSTQW